MSEQTIPCLTDSRQFTDPVWKEYPGLLRSKKQFMAIKIIRYNNGGEFTNKLQA